MCMGFPQNMSCLSLQDPWSRSAAAKAWVSPRLLIASTIKSTILGRGQAWSQCCRPNTIEACCTSMTTPTHSNTTFVFYTIYINHYCHSCPALSSSTCIPSAQIHSLHISLHFHLEHHDNIHMHKTHELHMHSNNIDKLFPTIALTFASQTQADWVG